MLPWSVHWYEQRCYIHKPVLRANGWDQWCWVYR